MKLLGIFDFVVALVVLYGACYVPKKWQQGVALVVVMFMCFIGGVTILESFV